ncbi:MAG: MopE-related protein [Pseudomonadota bacterium]|nr:MopE-related protein [Pseudomonadota bacterium]
MRTLVLLLAALGGCGSDPAVDADGDGDGAAYAADCDDHDATRFPGAVEHCDGYDEDCDGLADNQAIDALTTYTDLDGDGFGDPSTALAACVAPALGVTDGSDCDDTDPVVFPGAYERCDGRDEDCDGDIDGGAIDGRTRYPDLDGDGYGDEAGAVTACDALGAVEPGDCDDADADVFPGADERCDAVDTDCDGLPDVGAADGETWYPDLDGDGYGDAASAGTVDCEAAGRAANRFDCDDADAATNPATGGCGLPATLSPADAAATLVGLDTAAGVGGVHAVYDLDGDGVNELLVGAPDADTLYVVGGPLRGDESLERPVGLRRYVDGVGSFGGAVTAADLDGDGRVDLAVGAPTDATLGVEGGAVWIFAGPLTGSATTATATRALYPDNSRDRLGAALATLPDRDGDGLPELVVAAPGYGNTVGRVYLLPSTATDLTLPFGLYTGVASFDRAGEALATGDLDGDGLEELVIGAPGGAEAYVLLGGGSGTFNLSDADVTIGGRGDRYQTGTALAVVGDQDGDGLDDLLIGGPSFDSTSSSTGGEAWLLTGALASYAALPNAARTTFLGEAGGDRPGGSVAGGDLDGDGRDDLVMGATGNDGTGTDAGAAYVYTAAPAGTLALADADTVVRGHAAGLLLGSGVTAGDLDGDARAELIVGGVGETVNGLGAGATWVWLGGAP